MVTEKQVTDPKVREIRYWFLSMGTSLATTLEEVKASLPKALCEKADFFALDTNRDIME